MATAAHSLEDRIRRMTPVAAPPEQQAQVAALSRAMEGMVQAPTRRAPKCQLVGPSGDATSIPESVFYVLERVAEVLARGDSITVVPVGKEITTQQAADLLNRRQNEIALELRETQDKLVELEDKLHLAADIDRRTALTAPVAGRIVDMHVHTTGGVLRPGEPVLDIVPEADELIVEARVHPNDIDSVKVGAAAQVSLTAFKMRTTPRLDGVVIKVSADALVAEDRSSYYATEIQIDPGELEKLAGVALTPGMPAETMIRTGERTFLRYIGQPILDSFHRAFREE